MSATLLDLPSRPGTEPSSDVRPGGGCVTLEEALQSAWRGLHTLGASECPLCGGRMTFGAGAGECEGCGGRLT